MNDRNLHELADAYVDGELDIAGSLEFEAHLRDCENCKALVERQQSVRDAVRSHAPYFRAPESLEKTMRNSLHRENGVSSPAASPRRWLFVRPELAVAAGILGVIACGLILWQLLRPSPMQAVAQQVVGSHVRSLMADHLVDVPSSDQHTVKPWFNGKLDFAPAVKDLTSSGFPLIGGRLDYVDGHSAAVLVYKRRQHTINLLEWPSAGADSDLRAFTLRGFQLLHWTRSHMSYWAVSDLNEGELRQFAQLQRQ